MRVGFFEYFDDFAMPDFAVDDFALPDFPDFDVDSFDVDGFALDDFALDDVYIDPAELTAFDPGAFGLDVPELDQPDYSEVYDRDDAEAVRQNVFTPTTETGAGAFALSTLPNLFSVGGKLLDTVNNKMQRDTAQAVNAARTRAASPQQYRTSTTMYAPGSPQAQAAQRAQFNARNVSTPIYKQPAVIAAVVGGLFLVMTSRKGK